MNTLSASRPARPDLPNQDLAIITPDLAVLLDGAGGPSEDGGGCLHGVHWYVRQLGAHLLATLLPNPVPLAEALGRAVEQVADDHRGTCDLRNPGTPSSTVAIVRRRQDTVDHLALHDSTILLATTDGHHVISDRRVQRIPRLRELWAEMALLPLGTDRHAAARRAYITAELGYRNVPGGYWVAGADPHSAAEAVTGSLPAAGLRAAALLSDGVADYVDAYRQATWPDLLDLLPTEGPAALIDRVRAAEEQDPDGRRWPRFKPHDDATAVYWPLTA
ncbi:integrase [Kitasatospora sp. NPDC059327]|uniref:integrase n=1 Tax=Kitasatospora sp. NPDC059327 TaxID=3346803 RepID=UPI0036B966E0